MRNLHAQSPKEYPIERMCRLSGVSKQAYHKQKGESAMRKRAQEAFALEFIHEIRKEDPSIGGKKLWRMYRKRIVSHDRLGRDRFEALISRHNLNVRVKVRKPRTTDSTHGLPVYPNLVFAFIPTAVNQLWVSDITYIPIWLDEEHYTFCYLSLIMDGYSREIIGWSVGDTLEAKYPVEALEMALKRLDGQGKEEKRPIHHSDRGVQYASGPYIRLLTKNKIRISMTECGNPKDNAMAERINSTVKNELLKGMRFRSMAEVRKALEVAVTFYNTMRPHMSLDWMTPEEAARCNGEIKKWWRSYRDEAIKNGRA